MSNTTSGVDRPALDVVGPHEIAEWLGVSRQRVHQWQRDLEDFPAPAAELAAGRIWYRSDIEAWATATGRLSA